MKPFLDAGFLATLLLKAPGRQLAWELVQQFNPPHYLTHLHVLLIEHLFFHGQGSKERQAAAQAQTTWRRHLDEGVFQVEVVDWLPVANLAIDLGRRSLQHQAKPLHYLLAASAAATQSSHFLSFDPRTRYLARMAGLKLLPETL
jgi:hypothetical protein